MALLSQMMRTAAITGDPSRVNAWFADRQGKQWAERTVRRAFPQVNHRAPPADPAKTIEALTELRRRGVVTDAEVDALRSRLRLQAGQEPEAKRRSGEGVEPSQRGAATPHRL